MRRALLIAVVALAPAEALAVYQCGNVKDDCPCGASDPYPCCDNGGNCTWYAWEAACCAWGVGLPGWGNANQWSGNAAANASYQVLGSPVVSAVANRTAGTYGHVAFVQALNGGGGVNVNEENCWGNYGEDNANYSSGFFDKFIVRAGQVACSPGDTQTQSCGNCGVQSRSCGNDGAWAGWGACSSEGACAPGQTDSQACGTCGTQARTCNSSCQWDGFGACAGPDPDPDAGQAGCDAGLPGPCGAGQLECVDGELTCTQVVQPQAETCNGVDDDCDGVVDGPGICPVDAGAPDSGPGSGTPSVPGGAPAKGNAVSPRVKGGCGSAPGGELGLLLLAALALRRRIRAA